MPLNKETKTNQTYFAQYYKIVDHLTYTYEGADVLMVNDTGIGVANSQEIHLVISLVM